MSRGVNKVIIIGNLGQDPEVRYTGTGKAVCNMRIATNERYNDADGNPVDKTEWHNVVAWGRTAEICGEYLRKGSQAYFEGSLQTRNYDDKEGITRYVTEVVVRDMMLLGSRGGGADNGGNYAAAGYGSGGRRAPQSKEPEASNAESAETFSDKDDLPF